MHHENKQHTLANSLTARIRNTNPVITSPTSHCTGSS
jgi:hypothetical protein